MNVTNRVKYAKEALESELNSLGSVIEKHVCPAFSRSSGKKGKRSSGYVPKKALGRIMAADVNIRSMAYHYARTRYDEGFSHGKKVNSFWAISGWLVAAVLTLVLVF